MSLSEALQSQRARKGPPCSVGVILACLGSDDRNALEAALHDPTKTTRMIVNACATEGIALSHPAAARHRRGDCLCGAV